MPQRLASTPSARASAPGQRLPRLLTAAWSTVLILPLLFVLILGLATPALAVTPPDELRLVSFDPPPPAPPFSLPPLRGTTAASTALSLDDFTGRYVLLNFWATWCPPCVKEMPAMAQLAERFGDDRFSVVAVSLDTVDAAEIAAFTERLGLPFTVLLDPASEVGDAYGANALPATFLLDPQGRVIAAAKGERDWYSTAAQDYIARLLKDR